MSGTGVSNESEQGCWLSYTRKVFMYWAERSRALSLSALVLLFGYLFASHLDDDRWLSGAASIVSSFGLMLMIRHYLLASTESMKTMIEEAVSVAEFADYPAETADPVVISAVYREKEDEMVGVVLTLVGAFISGFGFLVPLANLRAPVDLIVCFFLIQFWPAGVQMMVLCPLRGRF